MKLRCDFGLPERAMTRGEIFTEKRMGLSAEDTALYKVSAVAIRSGPFVCTKVSRPTSHR